MTETNIERKARKSIIIYSALGIFLIGTIVFLVSIIPLYSRLKGGVQSNLVHAAKVRSMAVDEYILRAKDITLQVTSRTLMRKKLEAYNRGEITLEELIELTKDKLSDAMKLSEDVAGISRISTKGKLLLEVGLPLPERDLWPIPPENSREVTVYGPISMGGETYILVAAHIFGERATKAGTDIVIFKTDRLWLILHDRTGLGETGEVVLGVSKYGQTQLFSPMGEEKGFIIKSAMENSFQKKSGIMTSEDSYDKRVIIAYCPVQGAKWGIAVKMDAAELYSPINRQVILIFGIIAVLILAGTLGTVLLLRPLTDALHRELTDRRLAENALRESSELLEKVFSNTHLMIAYMDAAFNFIRVNRAYAEADGREPEFFAGRNHFELYPNEENRQIFQNVVDTGEPCFAYEKPFEYAKHPERGVTYWDWSLQPVKEAGGKVTGLVFTLLNVTERRRMEDALRKSEEQLYHARKMDAMGRFAGGITHDFNNILTAIIGYGSMVQMKLKEDDPVMNYVKQILASSEKAANLTKSLLAFSRKQIISPKPVNLNEIIKGIEKLFRRLIGEDIGLRIIPADVDLTVMADIGQIEQVLMNLATNARDAMPDGGHLTMETSVVEIGEEYLRRGLFERKGRYALLTVTDTGIGMDEKTRERIFEPFFTTKEVGKGTGLGLAIVDGIINQHNGYINVYSEPGRGTTFKMYLPLIEGEIKEIQQDVIPAIKGGTETLLLAEDDTDVRSLIKDILESYGYKVIDAADGEDALRLFHKNREDIRMAILDVVMPRKNGREVYEEIKRIVPDIKVLFMSGYTADIISEKGILKAGLDFISKPVSPKDLLKLVREILDR